MRVQSLILALAASLLCSNVFAQTRDIGLQVGLNVPVFQKAVEGFDEIIEDLPQAPENLEIAKAAILGPVQLVTLEEIFGY